MSELVTLQLGRIFTDFRSRVERLRDLVLADASVILKREEQDSIRERWYRTGATLLSLKEEVTTEGNKKTYHLMPTAVSKRGAPYPLFGEYGTGQRGALTGRPAPFGYRYGAKVGIAARRYSRIALSLARPKIDRMARERVRKFALSATV